MRDCGREPLPIILALVRPINFQIIGDELAIKWDDGGEGFIKLELLRRACPCAACSRCGPMAIIPGCSPSIT
jgi:DUF971 family protein